VVGVEYPDGESWNGERSGVEPPVGLKSRNVSWAKAGRVAKSKTGSTQQSNKRGFRLMRVQKNRFLGEVALMWVWENHTARLSGGTETGETVLFGGKGLVSYKGCE